MASIQCRNCKCGIHYHGEPSGIEFILIDYHEWEKIISSKFDPKKKVIDPQTGYPKLFRTDTIAEDFPEAIKKFWKCPECGSLIFFDRKGRVIAEYLPDTDPESDEIVCGQTAICFDDYRWDKITEAGMPVSKLAEKISSYIKIDSKDQTLYLFDALNQMIQSYKRIF